MRQADLILYLVQKEGGKTGGEKYRNVQCEIMELQIGLTKNLSCMLAITISTENTVAQAHCMFMTVTLREQNLPPRRRHHSQLLLFPSIQSFFVQVALVYVTENSRRDHALLKIVRCFFFFLLTTMKLLNK